MKINTPDDEVLEVAANACKKIIDNSKPEKQLETQELLMTLISEYNAVCSKLRNQT